MTPTTTRLHFLESERVLLGRHLASIAARREARAARAKAVSVPAETESGLSSAWLPVGGMVLLTMAMLAALVIPH